MFNPLSWFGDQSGAYDDAGNAFNQQAARYNPWIDRANRASDFAFDQYQQNARNPTFQQDAIAKNWNMSPYQAAILDNVTRRMNMNAANSGMIASPIAQDALNKQINTQTGQFLNDYVTQGLGQYNQSLSGINQIGQSGAGLLGAQDNLISQGIGARLKGAQTQNNAFTRLLGTGLGLGVMYGTGAFSGNNNAGGGYVSPGGDIYMNTPNMSYGPYTPFNTGGY